MKKITNLIIGTCLSFCIIKCSTSSSSSSSISDGDLSPYVNSHSYLKPEYLEEEREDFCEHTHQSSHWRCQLSSRTREWSLMIKQGYFYPQEESLRNIFRCRGTRGGYYIEADMRYHFCAGFNIEINGSYFSHKGCSLICAYDFICSNGISICQSKQKTKFLCGDQLCFRNPAIGFGLKYIYDYCYSMSFLCGIGIKLFFVAIDTQYPYVLSHESKFAPGIYIQTGIMTNPCMGFLLEFFADYLYGHMGSGLTCCSNSYAINVGGLVMGIGLGYRF